MSPSWVVLYAINATYESLSQKRAESCPAHNPLQKRIIHTQIFQIYWHDLHLPSMTSLLSKVGFLFY